MNGFPAVLALVLAGLVPVVTGDCEPGWVSYGDTCYYISSNRINKHDVETFCARRNSTIWIYKNDTERAYISNLVKEGPRILYYIGLSVVNHRWTWADGTPYNRNSMNWYRNQEPPTNNGQDCVGMLSYQPNTGEAQQKRCNEGWGIICTRPKAILDVCDMADGWQYINNRCLKLFTSPLTWADARKNCQLEGGGDLMVFKDWDDNREIDSLIDCRKKENDVWIGISDTVQPRTWRWINNDTLRYQRWVSYSNQILVNGSTCAAASAVDYWSWKHYTCDTRLKYICNRTVGQCPTGWLQHADRCYQPNVVPTFRLTWFDAKRYCEAQGTQMLIINSDDEQSFIHASLKGLKVDRAWLGFSDKNISDSLYWLDGRPVMGGTNYRHFDTNFPNPVANRFDCGLIIPGIQDSKWSNAYCFNMNAFFCEMKITGRPVTPTPAPVNYKCDKDWTLFRDHCYYFGPVRNQTTKDWNNARDYCTSSGGSLVVIGDPYEMSFITVNQAATVNAWIGLKYDTIARKLVWVDGSVPGVFLANETNFYPGEPDDLDNGQLCIEIIGGRQDYTGAWDDGVCNTSQGFICEKKAVPTSPPAVTGPTVPAIMSPFCDGPQWSYNFGDNHCYQVVLNRPKTWTAARADCVQRGGDLVSMSGREQQNFLQGMLSSGELSYVQVSMWIGASDQTQEGGWYWTDNAPFRFLNWYPGEPNNYLSGTVHEDCAEIMPSWNYMWNDAHCDKEQNYICKKQATQQATTTITPPAALHGPCPGVPMISGNYSVIDSTAFTASSSQSVETRPMFSRLSSGGWSANQSDPRQYIAVEFYGNIVVKGIQLAGKTDADAWVTKFKLQYQETYYASWLTYQNPPGVDMVFNGNTDASTVVTRMLMFPFEAKLVKLVPVTWHNSIALRLEILGCRQERCTSDYAISGPLIVDDANLTASSVFDIGHDAKASRLRSLTTGVISSCWKPLSNDNNQWLQADLPNLMIIQGVTIRGNPQAQEWVSQFKFSYRVSQKLGIKYYVEPYNSVKIIPGNTDNTSPVTYFFKSHFQARMVRIIPVAWHGAIALSFDILVCQNGCNGRPLINGKVPMRDDRLNASSMVDNRHSVYRSRLDMPASGAYSGAWIPKFSDTHQFIQVDLGYGVQVKAISTQGAADSQDWVKSYRLSFSSDGNVWNSYFELGTSPKVFEGNFENQIARKHYLLIGFIARFVRLWPLTWNNRIALRWEVYGCPGPDSGLQLGCFADNPRSRDLAFEPLTDPRVGMWPPMCIDHCFRQGYYYAGLQDQFKCFCGNSYGKYGPASNCTMQCMPKKDYFCGGPSSNMVYTTGLTPLYKVCPPHWKSYGDNCYILLLDRKSWYDARADCKIEGADLASPNNPAEQKFVDFLLGYGNGHNAWIGFNDIQDESLYNWADGRLVSYTNWGLGQPDHILHADQDCVLLQTNGAGWKSEACDQTHEYVCQMDKRPSNMPTQTPRVDGCPPGWDGFQQSCYLYSDAKRSWRDSKIACYSLSGNILRIRDRYEQAYISSVLGRRSGLYWTDVSDTASPGTYQHTTDAKEIVYTNWAMNKPDSTNQCVAVGTGNTSGLWYNWPCMMPFGVICEKARLGYTNPPLAPTTPPPPQCGPGTIQSDHYCYQINTGSKDWEDALADCITKGGNLASFHTADEIDHFWRYGLIGHDDMFFWIGLNDRAQENGYVWSDGSPVQAINWKPNEPNNYGGNEDCVEVRAGTGKWNDEKCSANRNWICAVPRSVGVFRTPTTIIPPTAGDSHKCGNTSWSYFNNFCYYVQSGGGDQGATWRQARAACQQGGGDLASIHSLQEQRFIFTTLTRQLQDIVVWIGYNEIDSTKGYRWSDGTPDIYRNWNKNEPNDYGGAEDCVNVYLFDGTWNDAHCASQRGYVCKRPVGGHPTPPAPTLPLPGNCPSGYSGLGNRCYRIYETTVSWDTAWNNCKSIGPGYNLASVRNSLENAFLVTLMADMHVHPWLAMRKNSDNSLQWITNDDVTYTNFARNEPNGKQNEKCIEMWSFRGQVGQWNDAPCSKQIGYVCMVNKDSMIPTPEPLPSLCDRRQGQVQFLTSCYFYVPQSLTWAKADAQCNTQGGYLSSINSEFEQAFVYITLTQHKSSSIWTGLSDRKLSGTYSWSDSLPVVYSNWDAGQPSATQGCVMMNGTGKWSDVSCNNTYPAVCKISKTAPSLTPPPPEGTCDPGWFPYHGKCYYYGLDRPLAAMDASVYCHTRSATLVSIHNSSVNAFLVATINGLVKTQAGSFWTGLHKSLDSSWQWLDLTPVQFTNWRPGEPSVHGWGGNIENCMEVFLSDGKWNDEDCNSQRMFVCERQIGVDSNTQHIGTGQVPVPFTRPSILPPQIEPTLSSRTASQVTPKIPPVTGPPIRTNPPIVGPVTNKRPIITVSSRQPVTSSPQTTQATLGATDASKASLGGLNGGSIAGIVLGSVIAILLIVLVALFLIRRSKGLSVPGSVDDTGFTNRTYDYGPQDREEIDTRNGMSLRTMSESSS